MRVHCRAALCLVIASLTVAVSGAQEAANDLSALAERLRRGDVEERRDAAMRLGASGRVEATGLLTPGLDDANEIVRATVAGQLGALGDSAATGPLVSRLGREKRPFVRKEIVSALGALGDRSATPALHARLDREKDREVRAAIAVALAALGDPASRAVLGRLLRDEDPFVRREAARGLGRIGARDAVLALAERLEGDEEAEVRRQAAWALGTIGDVRARAALAAAVHDEDPYVSDEAFTALARLGETR
jgi:HEAT repeat protein